MTKERGPAGTANFLYDAAGNLSKVNGTPTYTHSARGRLASVAVAADSVNYLYNGLEQRVVKSSTNTTLVPGGARFFAYDEQGHTIGEYDQDGNPVYEVVYLGDTPVAVITQTRTVVNGVLNVQTNLSYVYSDHIDTPRVIVRSNDQAIQWRWDQAEAYGNTPPNDNPNGLGSFAFNLRFPGQLFDAESNLVYNVNRYYDASSGRYVQSDPIGLQGGINTYAYVESAPTMYSDPSGLVKHTTGRTIDCGKGCTIRIDYTFDERTGVKTRHLHWECKGKEGVCGEDGDPSHGGTWDDVPEQIKECARRHGFNGAPRSSGQTWKYIVGGIVIIGGVILFPEVTIPAIGIGAAAR